MLALKITGKGNCFFLVLFDEENDKFHLSVSGDSAGQYAFPRLSAPACRVCDADRCTAQAGRSMGTSP